MLTTTEAAILDHRGSHNSQLPWQEVWKLSIGDLDGGWGPPAGLQGNNDDNDDMMTQEV